MVSKFLKYCVVVAGGSMYTRVKVQGKRPTIREVGLPAILLSDTG